MAGGAIEDLGGEVAHFVRDDLVSRDVVERLRRLRVALRRRVRLVSEVEMDGRGRPPLDGLAAVPHHGAEEREVRRG